MSQSVKVICHTDRLPRLKSQDLKVEHDNPSPKVFISKKYNIEQRAQASTCLTSSKTWLPHSLRLGVLRISLYGFLVSAKITGVYYHIQIGYWHTNLEPWNFKETVKSKKIREKYKNWLWWKNSHTHVHRILFRFIFLKARELTTSLLL